MVLQDYKIEGDYIKVSKADLEMWNWHYWAASIGKDEDYERGFYLGKAVALEELLELFEQED